LFIHNGNCQNGAATCSPSGEILDLARELLDFKTVKLFSDNNLKFIVGLILGVSSEATLLQCGKSDEFGDDLI